MFMQVAGCTGTMVVMNPTDSVDDHDQDVHTSTISDESIEGTSQLSYPNVALWTSTPVKANDVDCHQVSSSDCDASDGSVCAQPSTSFDSDTLTSASLNISSSTITSGGAVATEESNCAQSSPSQPSCASDGVQPTTVQESLRPAAGYKFVIDNIDKNVKPRDMRVDAQTKSLHYVHAYGVKDRVDFSSLSGVAKCGEMRVDSILPSSEDYKKLKQNMSIIVARTMSEHLSFFCGYFKGLIKRHVSKTYSAEMSTKSEVVSWNL